MFHYKCPVCRKNIFEYKINKEFKICQYCKTVYKTHVENLITPICYPDAECSVRNLQSDKNHYQTLKNELKNDIRFPNYSKIISFFTGFPKLETVLFSSQNNNSDKKFPLFISFGFEDLLKPGIENFQAIYNDDGFEIKYLNSNYDDHTITKVLKKYITPDGTHLITFTHVLEHIRFDNMELFLDCCTYFNNYKNVDIIIYGPNISNACDANWVHFSDKHHITFVDWKYLIGLMKRNGFKLQYQKNFYDDYFMYFTNREILYLEPPKN